MERRRQRQSSSGGSSETLNTFTDSDANDRNILLNMKKTVNGNYQRTNTMDTEDDENIIPGTNGGKYDYHYPHLIGGHSGSSRKKEKEHDQLKSEQNQKNILRKSSETSVARIATDE